MVQTLKPEGNRDEARKRQEEGVQNEERLHGKDHPIIVIAMDELAQTLTAVAQSFSIIILTFLLGCTANAPYRDLNVLSDPSNFGGYIGREPQQKSFYGRTVKDPYDLAFIEFDEKGDFWDRQQLGHAYKQIEKLSRNPSKPPLLLTYIHGWQNNASDETHDVANFQNSALHLAKQLRLRG
jgi:hypothetical protein